METNGGDAYWLNGNNERQNRNIHNMVRAGLLDMNQHKKQWCCAEETPAEFHRRRIKIALDNISPQFACYGKKPIIHELRTFGYDIYPITSSPKKLDDRTQEGLFVGYTNIRSTIK